MSALTDIAEIVASPAFDRARHLVAETSRLSLSLEHRTHLLMIHWNNADLLLREALFLAVIAEPFRPPSAADPNLRSRQPEPPPTEPTTRASLSAARAAIRASCRLAAARRVAALLGGFPPLNLDRAARTRRDPFWDWSAA